MHASRLRIAAFLIIALCPGLAQAKGPAAPSQTVDIRSGLAQNTPPPGHNLPTSKGRVNVRDPFVDQSEHHNQLRPAVPSGGDHKPGPVAVNPPAPSSVKPVPVVCALPPPVTILSGVILSASGNQAILTSPSHTYLVRRGDKLGDYTVSEVLPGKVTLRFKDKAFAIKMQNEFTAMATHPGKKK